MLEGIEAIAGRARAMATASPWTPARGSSRTITKATPVGPSTNAIRRSSPATPTGGPATRSPHEAVARCFVVSSKACTAHCVGSMRRVNGIHGYLSAERNGEWLTLRDAAAKLGVSHHQVRKLIDVGVLDGWQIMPDAPQQIRTTDLDSGRVTAALARKGRPCRAPAEKQISMSPDTCTGGAQ